MSSRPGGGRGLPSRTSRMYKKASIGDKKKE